jgi:hypothetical protein
MPVLTVYSRRFCHEEFAEIQAGNRSPPRRRLDAHNLGGNSIEWQAGLPSRKGCGWADSLQRRWSCRRSTGAPKAKAVRSEDWKDASKTESARSWKEYFGYFGTYSIDLRQRAVIHHVEGAWFPNLLHTDQVRHFRFEGSKLVLHTDTKMRAGSHRVEAFASLVVLPLPEQGSVEACT